MTSTNERVLPSSVAARAAKPAPTAMTGAQAVVRSLEELGVTSVFGLLGGAILPIYDAIFDSRKLRHILVRHEQGAGHAAEGYASASGRVGVCMATSGPGAMNLATSIVDASMDSVPVVAITGQVNAPLIGTDAFQEADIVGATLPHAKHSFLVKDGAEIPQRIAEAFHIASTGRPGPVLVDIAKSAQNQRIDFTWPPPLHLPGYRPITRPHSRQVREAARLLATASRPVLYVGGGAIRARASEVLRQLADLSGAPVVTTLMARGAVPDSHPQHLGMPGMHGSVAAVAALQQRIAALDAATAIWLLTERTASVVLQIGLVWMVWNAIERRRSAWLAAAVLAHALIDVPAALFHTGTLPLWAIEIFYLSLALLVVVPVWRHSAAALAKY